MALSADFDRVFEVTPVFRAEKSFTHRHRTIHLQAVPATLARLAREILGVDLETVRKEMFPQ